MKLNIQLFGGRGAKSGGGGSSNKGSSFNDMRFEGLGWSRISNNYVTLKSRVNKKEDRIVVRVGDSQLKKTAFGHALILDNKNVVFIKDWQVSKNYYGNEVMLTKKYFKPKSWGNHENFFDDKKNLSWKTWLDAAKAQQKLFPVKWEDGKSSKKKYRDQLLYGR